MMPTYSRDTLVTVHPFTRQIDGEEVIIGVIETGVFLAVPPEAVELLEHFSQGKNVGQVADFYQQRYGEVLDIGDFLGLLETKGIVESLEGSVRSVNMQPARQQVQRVRYHFANFPQSLAQGIFSRPVLAAVFFYRPCTRGNGRRPSLAPHASDFYFPDHRALSWIILNGHLVCGDSVHEMGHLVATRAWGSTRAWASATACGIWSRRPI